MKTFIKIRLKELILAGALVVALFSSTAFGASANDHDLSKMTDEQLIKLTSFSNSIKKDGVAIVKVNDFTKKDIIEGMSAKELTSMNVYIIDRELDNGIQTHTVVADVPVTLSSGGTSTNQKEGRATIASTLKYESRNFNKDRTCYKGVSFGGRVVTQQSGVQVTEIKGFYSECGTYYNSSGSQGLLGIPYTKSKTFDKTKMRTTQLASVSTGRYFDTANGGTGVSAKFTAKYKVSGKSYTISVLSNVPKSV